MQLKKFVIAKDILLLAYKLSYDLLLLILITFAGAIIAEGLLPGLVSSKISFGKITVALFLVLLLITTLSQKLDLAYKQTQINKHKILPPLILFSFLLIGNSLLKFSLWENITITLGTLFVFFLFYEIIYTSKE